MNRISTTLAAALLASSMAGGVAFAADAGTSTQAGEATAGGTAQTAPAEPSVGNMDTNAQRAHSPSGNTGTDSSGTTSGNAGATGGSAGTTGSDSAGASGAAAGGNQNTAASGETRDWSQIDANNDNLIGPEEMEEALKATGPQAGQQR